MSHRITELFETPQQIPMVAGWIYDAFWADKDEMTVETLSRRLEDAKQSDAIPLSLLAWSGEEPAGTVNLESSVVHERSPGVQCAGLLRIPAVAQAPRISLIRLA